MKICDAGSYKTCESDINWRGGQYGQSCSQFQSSQGRCTFDSACYFCCECINGCPGGNEATKCLACPVGKYSNAGATICNDCTVDTYSSSSECMRCDVGSGATGTSSCVCGKDLYAGSVDIPNVERRCGPNENQECGMQVNSPDNAVNTGSNWLLMAINNNMELDDASCLYLWAKNGITWWRIDFGSPKRLSKFNIRYASGYGLRFQVGNIDAVDSNPLCAATTATYSATGSYNRKFYDVSCPFTGQYMFIRHNVDGREDFNQYLPGSQMNQGKSSSLMILC